MRAHASVSKRLVTAVSAVGMLAATPGLAQEAAEVLWSWSFEPPSPVNDNVATVLGVGDLDGDGYADVLAACEDYTVRALSGHSTGTAQLIWTFGGDNERPEGDRTLSLAPDTDGDGLPEVLFVGSAADRAVHLLSGADGSQLWEWPIAQAGCSELSFLYTAVPVGDLNRDGVWDAAVAVGAPCKRVFALSGQGHGGQGKLLWQQSAGDGFHTVAAAGDLTGDRRPDVLAGSGTNGIDNRLLLLDGRPGAGPSRVVFEHTAGQMVSAATAVDDFTGDGRTEVVAGSWDGTVFAVDGASRGVVPTPLWETPITGGLYDMVSHALRVPDLDGDCVDDAAIASFSNRVRIVSGATGQPVWPPQVIGTGALTSATSATVLPDVTGDLQWDLAVGTWNPGRVALYSGADGAPLWEWSAPENVASLSWVEDIDDDGLADVVAGLMDDATVYAFSGRPVDVCVRPTSEVTGVVVDRIDEERIRLAWNASTDTCHGRYRVLGVPADVEGCFARLVDLTEQDEDASSSNPSWTGPADWLGYLVVDEAPGGGLGPLGHFRR